MVKFLLSLMLLASGWAWGAEVLPHDGVAEAKAESVVIKMSGEEYKRVKEERPTDFEGKIVIDISDKVAWILPMDKAIAKSYVLQPFSPDFEGMGVSGNEFFILEDDFNDVAASVIMHYMVDEPIDWSALSPYELIDVLRLQGRLAIEYFPIDDSRLYNNIVKQLLYKAQNNDPEILQLLQDSSIVDYLNEYPGLNLSQAISGTSASWSPDGSKLWVEFWDQVDRVSKVQVYQIIGVGLRPMGDPIPGHRAGWSPDGSKLLVHSLDASAFKVLAYRGDRLGVLLSEPIPGDQVGWSQDGSKFWTEFYDNGAHKIQIYQVDDDRPTALLKDPILGSDADWSPDGSKLRIKIYDHRDSIMKTQVYRVIGDKLEALLSEPIPGNNVGWSQDGSKLWIEFNDHGISKIQVYQIISDGLKALLSKPVRGESAGWSLDGSRLWVGFHGRDAFDRYAYNTQIYQIDDDRLRALLGTPISSVSAGWSSDGSKLWVGFYVNGEARIKIYQVAVDNRLKALLSEPISGEPADWSSDGSKLLVIFDNKIQVYQAIGNRLEALLSEPIPGHKAKWSPDGFRLLVFNDVTHQITVYFNIFLTYPDLSLAQQMLLIYVLNAHQMTNTAYTLPIELKTAWDFLPEPLRDHLVSNHIVNIATVSTDAKAA